MPNRPIIGVLAGRRKGNILPEYFTTGHYVEQLDAAGATPVLLPFTLGVTIEQVQAWVRLCDGVLIPGGGDFPAEMYGEKPLPGFDISRTAYAMNRHRLEIEFIRLAAEAGKPILGICRGEQAINIAFGGSLYQDIPTQFGRQQKHRQNLTQRARTTHTVSTAEGSLLRQLVQAEELRVNTYHHQAVRQAAPGFVVSAYAPDGLPEAIECPERRILGVQWHPENLASKKVKKGEPLPAEAVQSKALFRWLVDEASR